MATTSTADDFEPSSERLASLRTLAAGLANEINTPLTSVLANLEHAVRRLRVLANGDRGDVEDLAIELPDLVETLAHAVEAADRVRRLTHDLMVFSRCGVERRVLVDVRSVVEAAIHIAAPEIRARARLERALAEVPAVDADEGRLAQALVSILVNAAQSIPEAGAAQQEVRVSTGKDAEGRAVIEVSDTGTGIAPDVLEHVFDPFYTTRPARGIGLGLSFAYGTVTSLGGEMSVESEVGEGSTVRVVLPAARSQRAEPKSVLVIADDPQAGKALARALGEGHTAVVAGGADDALALLQSQRFDVVVCDTLPPGMCVVDLYAQAVRVAPRLADRFVFLTGGMVSERTRSLIEGMRPRCLEKPPDLARLRELIRRTAACAP
jgi:nitrogen-specific signal transduction histidine kinase/CheY-like chemotaxis protein